MSECIKIAIIDGQQIYCRGIVSVLSEHDIFHIVGIGETSDDAARIMCERQPDILLLDIDVPNNIRLTRDLGSSNPKTRVILLARVEKEEQLAAAMQAGAAGYVAKDIAAQALIGLINEVHQGVRYMNLELAARALGGRGMPRSRDVDKLSQLTARERQVANHVARALTNKEIARALVLSEKTVKYHMTTIMQKLDARNRSEVVLIAAAAASESTALTVRSR